MSVGMAGGDGVRSLIRDIAQGAGEHRALAEQRIREQQYVQPGTPLVDVLDDSGYELEFLAPSTWLSRLRVGMVVRVQIDEVRRNGLARIVRISPRIDPVSQSIKVTAQLEGALGDLKAGMSGRLQMP